MSVSYYTAEDVQSVCIFLFMLWDRRAVPKWDRALAALLTFQEVANA